MFVGHYGVSFAAKPVVPRVPLWALFVAAQWLDIVWSILVLLGIEKLRIDPGLAHGFDFYDMPYSHGLPGSILLSLILGAMAVPVVRGRRRPVVALIAAVSFSHWILDLIVHLPDLPLYDNTAKVGFGLWQHFALSFPLEVTILGLGAWLWAHTAIFTSRRGRLLYWSFVLLLALLQIYVDFGPPPSSPADMAILALVTYTVLAVLAAWVERFAVVSTREAR
jgi:hypothetical protein